MHEPAFVRCRVPAPVRSGRQVPYLAEGGEQRLGRASAERVDTKDQPADADDQRTAFKAGSHCAAWRTAICRSVSAPDVEADASGCPHAESSGLTPAALDGQ
ncbi:hypothetical protein [Streptomyces sp. NPDC054863]